jgi:hypothetical protein
MSLPKLSLNKTDFTDKGIQITLFQRCNLHCSFCFQSDIKPSLENPYDNWKIIFNNIQLHLPTIQEKNITYKLLGGELFLPDADWDWYEQIIEDLIQTSVYYNKVPSFVFMTNIIHDEIIRNKVVMLCSMIQTHGYKVVVAPSFDFSGRFSNISLLNIFNENCRFYQQHSLLSQCNMVLTKTTCDLLTGKKLPDDLQLSAMALFKQLYKEGIVFDVDYYAAGNQTDDPEMPSDIDLLDTFIYLWDNFPNIRLLQGFKFSDIPTKLNCRSELQLTNEICTEDCRAFYKQENNQMLQTESGQDYKQRIITKFMDKNNCMLCKWYRNCPMGCFFYWDNIMKKVSDICIYKKFFEYIQASSI